MGHAMPRPRAGGGGPYTPVLSDYLGTVVLSNATCTNNLSCCPSYCTPGTNAACVVGRSNTSEAALQASVASVTAKTCAASTDVRCTTAALTAVFGRFPGIKAAYCNDIFLVLHSSDAPNHPSSLGSIFTPPGGGGSGGYASQCVTRDYYRAWYVFKIPLSVALLPTASGTVNNANAFQSPGDSLVSFNGLTNVPTRGPVAYTVSGIPMFPNQNNMGSLTFISCETDMCNTHAGMGFDIHHHGDPFGPQCLYSCANYSTIDAHPPLIGYGADGIPLFGRYLSAAAPGQSVALDACGGHVHSGISDAYIADGTYHYHSFISNIPAGASPQPYTAFLYGPYSARPVVALPAKVTRS